jgi:hypothetical protein
MVPHAGSALVNARHVKLTVAPCRFVTASSFSSACDERNGGAATFTSFLATHLIRMAAIGKRDDPQHR